jgi:hypothetical protein
LELVHRLYGDRRSTEIALAGKPSRKKTPQKSAEQLRVISGHLLSASKTKTKKEFHCKYTGLDVFVC